MEIKYSLKVSAPAFFAVIRDSVLEELHTFGKLPPEETAIEEGMAYSKILKRGKRRNRTIVKITQYEEARRYQTRIKSDDGRVFEITYLLEPNAAGGCELTYSEELYQPDGTQDVRMRTFLFGKISARGIKHRFRKIEKTILQKENQA